MNENKYIHNPIKFLCESGLLFELNRQVLHPLGLALQVITVDTKDEIPGADQQSEFRCLLQDSREDPEGIVYEAETFNEALKRLAKYYEGEGGEALRRRQETLGFIQQVKGEL